MDEIVVKIGTHGRLVIPAGLRKSLGVEEGDELLLRLVDDELRISTPAAAIARAQRIVGKYLPAGRSLVDELLEERRVEDTSEP